MTDAGLRAQLACIWEATARKPGNVHRFRDFTDVTYLDFLLSAAAIAPVLGQAVGRRVGETVLRCVQATRRLVASNTNLGIVLLLAPLAAIPEDADLASGLERVLVGLDVEDARMVYEAIRLANPGGLGRAPEEDVSGMPTRGLPEVMALAAERDLVARQYANGYSEVREIGEPALRAGLVELGTLEGAILHAQVTLLARHPDTLIARKRGMAEAAEASRRAAEVLASGWPATAGGRQALAELDAWLRQDGHQRNPGATADLLTAALFLLLRQDPELPGRYPWSLPDGEAPWQSPEVSLPLR
jgi:triphosphoribosyl-dephospho-CoA synthase